MQDDGYATAEAAMVLPALVVVLVMALWVVTSVGAELRCVDAARAAVRAQARGDDGRQAGLRVAPDGAAVSVGSAGKDVTATVSVTVRPLGHVLPVPGVRVHASAQAEKEGQTP